MTHAIPCTFSLNWVVTDTFQLPGVEALSFRVRRCPVTSATDWQLAAPPGAARQIRTCSGPVPQRSSSLIRIVRGTPERRVIVLASRFEQGGVVTARVACWILAGDSVVATTVPRSGAQRQLTARLRVAVPPTRRTTPIWTVLAPSFSLSLTLAPSGPVTTRPV